MSVGLEVAIEFNLRSEAQPEFARWLESNGVHLSQVLNLVGPIVEHDIVVFPSAVASEPAGRWFATAIVDGPQNVKVGNLNLEESV